MCCSSLRLDRSIQDACFFNSATRAFSRNDVITLIVLGVLSLMLAVAALYGYFIDPSWIIGAHVLSGATLCVWGVIGVLVIAKYLCKRSEKETEDNSFGGLKGTEEWRDEERTQVNLLPFSQAEQKTTNLSPSTTKRSSISTERSGVMSTEKSEVSTHLEKTKTSRVPGTSAPTGQPLNLTSSVELPNNNDMGDGDSETATMKKSGIGVEKSDQRIDILQFIKMLDLQVIDLHLSYLKIRPAYYDKLPNRCCGKLNDAPYYFFKHLSLPPGHSNSGMQGYLLFKKDLPSQRWRLIFETSDSDNTSTNEPQTIFSSEWYDELKENEIKILNQYFSDNTIEVGDYRYKPLLPEENLNSSMASLF